MVGETFSGSPVTNPPTDGVGCPVSGGGSGNPEGPGEPDGPDGSNDPETPDGPGDVGTPDGPGEPDGLGSTEPGPAGA
ncbi:hypothetical protein BG844_33390 [Couchioplanes caeruleus subsp. caeruleus]|uniref:Uncharacterized protein n=1 Tax=Couchioplanes caeruleus subsp. caeruleus TaxID=56427 RepID=A0A1K0FBH6_9ACTN|nr:hypothetical protein BG844_33390 [Couchioplanes caeruleus subsp. caeruleus]